MRTLLIILALALLTGCLKDDPLNKPFQSSLPQEINDGIELSTPEEEGMDPDMLKQIYTDIYNMDELWSLRSMLVFRNGRLVAESYLKDDVYRSQPQLIWSCTKQVMAILVGIAVEQGIISSLDDPISAYFPGLEENHPEKADITILQLLTMHSGIDYNNDGADGETDKVLRQIPDDLTSYVLSLPMREDPGSSFWYNDGDPQLLASLLQETLGKPTDEWAEEVFFSKIGFSNYSWTRYKDGTTIGGYGIETSPREMGKIALCVADSGRYKQQQVLPSDWVSQMITPRVEVENYYDMGYYWWVDPTRDIQFMNGHGGQYAYIVPSESLVVVMTSIPNTQGDYQIQPEEALPVVDRIIKACSN